MAERDSGGAAKRRRERRLRMHWRHEQLMLRMVLQTTATRTKAEERETYSAPRRQEPPLPQLELFQFEEESRRFPATLSG